MRFRDGTSQECEGFRLEAVVLRRKSDTLRVTSHAADISATTSRVVRIGTQSVLKRGIANTRRATWTKCKSIKTCGRLTSFGARKANRPRSGSSHTRSNGSGSGTTPSHPRVQIAQDRNETRTQKERLHMKRKSGNPRSRSGAGEKYQIDPVLCGRWGGSKSSSRATTN